MKKLHKIKKITFNKDRLIIVVDGREHSFRVADISNKLTNASSEERAKYEISPSGYGIHWPLLDEDLSIDGLIGIKRKKLRSKETISA